MNKNLKEFKEYLEYEKKYPLNTVNSYISDINFFLNYLSSINKNINQVNKEVIRSYLKVLSDLKYKSSTIARNLSSLRCYFDYLLVNNYVKNNVFKLISNPKKEKKLPNFLTYQEFEDMIDSIDSNNIYAKRNKLILELLLASGVRVSELVNIKLKDIDINNKTIKVMGKGSKERIVYFNLHTKESLINYLENDRLKLLKCKIFGDDTILQTAIKFLEKEGFEVLPVDKIVKDIKIQHGIAGNIELPNDDYMIDIELGVKVLKQIGDLDIGQSIVIQNGIVMGIECIEGTEKLIERCGQLKYTTGRKPILVEIKSCRKTS